MSRRTFSDGVKRGAGLVLGVWAMTRLIDTVMNPVKRANLKNAGKSIKAAFSNKKTES